MVVLLLYSRDVGNLHVPKNAFNKRENAENFLISKGFKQDEDDKRVYYTEKYFCRIIDVFIQDSEVKQEKFS